MGEKTYTVPNCKCCDNEADCGDFSSGADMSFCAGRQAVEDNHQKGTKAPNGKEVKEDWLFCFKCCDCDEEYSNVRPPTSPGTGEPCPEGYYLDEKPGSAYLDNPCETCYKCKELPPATCADFGKKPDTTGCDPMLPDGEETIPSGTKAPNGRVVQEELTCYNCEDCSGQTESGPWYPPTWTQCGPFTQYNDGTNPDCPQLTREVMGTCGNCEEDQYGEKFCAD
jgi:hypothetical protein